MPEYMVTLARTFAVTIEAENAQRACEISELYVGYKDDSKPIDKKRFKFSIEEIEMTWNDAVEAEEIR